MSLRMSSSVIHGAVVEVSASHGLGLRSSFCRPAHTALDGSSFLTSSSSSECCSASSLVFRNEGESRFRLQSSKTKKGNSRTSMSLLAAKADEAELSNVTEFRPIEPATSSLLPVEEALDAAQRLDNELSRRPLELDPAGYFIIYIDPAEHAIVAKHYRNSINENGLACDPETGNVIPCDGSYKPRPHKVFRGRTAKEISVAIIEASHSPPLVTMLSHANYLGREFQRAENALYTDQSYVQD